VVGATGNFTITEAVATSVGTGVLLLGGFYARRYGKRADPVVRARTFPRANGEIGLEVQVQVKSVGLTAIRIRDGVDHLPTLTIMDVLDDGLRFSYQIEDQRIVQGLMGQLAGPGEAIRCTELFLLQPPGDPSLVGWQAELVFDVRRPVKRWRSWTWRETAFVPAGELSGEDDRYTGEDHGDTD
jgi:hypothetical protein